MFYEEEEEEEKEKEKEKEENKKRAKGWDRWIEISKKQKDVFNEDKGGELEDEDEEDEDEEDVEEEEGGMTMTTHLAVSTRVWLYIFEQVSARGDLVGLLEAS